MSKFATIAIGVLAVFLALPLVASCMSKTEGSQDGPGVNAEASSGPILVSSNPASGATDVSPAVTEITATFNAKMQPGCSWTGSGPNLPEITGQPTWSADGMTCTLPVRLKPDWSYKVGLNSPSHRNFKSADGNELPPTEITFQTGQS
ncbi:MAG: Ig-like domain-containing protein [FCB group bacterium]|jgi:hypothetical protein|nr:Ig-like domain-containing protein [FCB group bacterium]